MNEFVIQETVLIHNDNCYYISIDRGVSLTMYAPSRKGGGQVSFTFLLCITCKKGGRGCS